MTISCHVPTLTTLTTPSHSVAKPSALVASDPDSSPLSLDALTRATTLLLVELFSFFITVDPLSWEFVHVADNGYAPSSIVLILFALSMDNAIRKGLLRRPTTPGQQRALFDRFVQLQLLSSEQQATLKSSSSLMQIDVKALNALNFESASGNSKSFSSFDLPCSDVPALSFKVPQLEYTAPLDLSAPASPQVKPVQEPELPLYFPEELDESFVVESSPQQELLASIQDAPDDYMLGGAAGFIAAQCINNRSRRRRRRTRRAAAHAAAESEQMKKLRELFAFAPNIEMEGDGLELDDIVCSIISQFFEVTELSPEVLLTTVVYLKRLQKVGGLCLQEDNWCLAFVTAASLAQKWVDDVCYTAGDLCEQLPLFASKIVEENEIAAVQLLNWDLRVSNEELHEAWVDVEGEDYMRSYTATD